MAGVALAASRAGFVAGVALSVGDLREEGGRDLWGEEEAGVVEDKN